MTEDGNYFIGASMDFSSNDHAIYKWSGPDVDKVMYFMEFLLAWLLASCPRNQTNEMKCCFFFSICLITTIFIIFFYLKLCVSSCCIIKL